jgi:antitoxin CcdA
MQYLMRIMCAFVLPFALTMDTHLQSTRKRPVNLTLNEALVTQAKAYTNNLSATMESLLEEFVLSQQKAQRDHLRVADACATDWNTVHESFGSFADEHSNL